MKDRVLLILLLGFIFGFIYVIEEIIDYGKKKKGKQNMSSRNSLTKYVQQE
jgi:flagellar biogenesis protein FliO